MTTQQDLPTPQSVTGTPGTRLILPGDAAYDAARGVFNLTLDQRPAAIAQPESVDDVVALMRHARDHGLRVAPQATGHNAGPLGDLAGTLLLRTERMKGVSVNAADRTARANAGAVWEDLVGRASELGLAALHGSSPDVGIVGYSIGGGMGWYARKWGLATNHVTAIELVTPAGAVLRATHEDHPDLFWALRGGGGNFGVVTAIEFRLFPVTEVYAGALFFPWERAADVLHTWNGLRDGFPDELTSVGRLLQIPPLPHVPEPLRGRAFVVVEAAYLGSQAGGEALLAPLRALGPEIDTFAMVPPAGLAELHMHPREPMPAMTTHELLTDLTPSTIDAVLDVAGAGSGSAVVSLEFRHTGGALARPAGHHGARGTLPGSLCMFAVGVPAGPEVGAALQSTFAAVRGALGPHLAGHYLNFVEERFDAEPAFEPAAWQRLLSVRAQHDPDGVMQANHPVRGAH